MANNTKETNNVRRDYNRQIQFREMIQAWKQEIEPFWTALNSFGII